MKEYEKLYVVNGDICNAYQSKVRNIRYTLIYNLKLVSHSFCYIEAKIGWLCLTIEVEITECHNRLKSIDCKIRIELNEKIKDF